MLDLARAWPILNFQYLLHGFKQCGRNNWLKATIKPFITMPNEAEIRPLGK
ncbi:MAG TPA: hypothetical protein VJB98_00235 [Candidatus Paceibacterota bacterium]